MATPWVKVSDIKIGAGTVSLARDPEAGAYHLTKEAPAPDPYGKSYHVVCPVEDVEPADLLASLGQSIEQATAVEADLRAKLSEEERRVASAARVNT